MDGLKSKAILALIAVLDWLSWLFTRGAGRCAAWALQLRPHTARGLKTEIEWVVTMQVNHGRALARVWGINGHQR